MALGNNVRLFGDNISNLGPLSESSSLNKSENQSSSRSSGSNFSNSFSGLDQANRNRLLDSVMPQMEQSVGNMYGNIDQYTKNATDLYKSTANSMLKDSMPAYLDQLAAKGVLNSTMGQNSLGDALTNLTRGAADKSYESGMQAAQMKYNMPSMLSPLINLGQYSQGESGGSTNSYSDSESSSEGVSDSRSTNTLAPYELLMNSYLGLGA